MGISAYNPCKYFIYTDSDKDGDIYVQLHLVSKYQRLPRRYPNHVNFRNLRHTQSNIKPTFDCILKKGASCIYMQTKEALGDTYWLLTANLRQSPGMSLLAIPPCPAQSAHEYLGSATPVQSYFAYALPISLFLKYMFSQCFYFRGDHLLGFIKIHNCMFCFLWTN